MVHLVVVVTENGADGSMGIEQVGAFLQGERNRWGAATREIGLLPE